MMELIIGDKVWSTWSMRPWLALKATGAPFKEVLVRLRQETSELTGDDIEKAGSPSRMVPALRDGDIVIWDSLAICEYLHETFPGAKLWPEDRILRALGRSAAAEMHAGFMPLRAEHPMDLTLKTVTAPSEAVRSNLARLDALWTGLLARSGGPFLLGEFTIADAFYTPVATRVRSHGLPMSGTALAYVDRLLAREDFRQWEREALADERVRG
jgi:glutathione S-transferase